MVEIFRGVGALGSVSRVEEGTEIVPFAITLQLSGLDPAAVSVALQDRYQGRPARIWFALLDEDHAFIGVPVPVFGGTMDTQVIALGETATIAVTIRSELADWRRGYARIYADADQQSEYPGDRGFEFATQQESLEIFWGRAS